jgi:fructose-1,6-bisphosphatase/inositol monophosphatase family enzyme
VTSTRLTPPGLTPPELLELFDTTSKAVRDALEPISGAERRARTDRAGQYALDLVADDAALAVLHKAPLAIVSEESGRTGADDAAVTVVIDPVDGSTNCSRGIPYWATSIAAIDGDGLLAGYVVNHATGVVFTATRGGGAFRDGLAIAPAPAVRLEDCVIGLSGLPAHVLAWKQVRALGSAALTLCDVACGAIEGFVDGAGWHAPWDYLGGLLVCREAGATLFDVAGRELVTDDIEARRQLLAGCTETVANALRSAV